MLTKKDTAGGTIWQKKLKSSDIDFKYIEAAGDISFNSKQKKQITLAINHYIKAKGIHAASPDAKKVKERAEEILEFSKQMESFFRSSRSKSNIDKALISRIIAARPHWDVECDLSDSQFTFLNARLKAAIDSLTKQSSAPDGPEGDEILNTLICEVLKIYTQAFTKSTSGTQHLALILSIIQNIPEKLRPHIHSEESLKKRVRRQFKKISQGT